MFSNSRAVLISIVSVAAFYGAWWGITALGWIKPLLLPSPFAVLQAGMDLGWGLFPHVQATAFRILSGFTIGAAGGIMLGLLTSYFPFFGLALQPHIESWRPVPPVALVPFFILWFGFSVFGKLLLVSLGCALILVVQTQEAVRNISPRYIRAAHSLGLSKVNVYRMVVLPAILPELRSGLRIALALSVSLVVVSEFLGAQEGLGYLITVAKVTFSTPTILLGIILLGFLSFTFDWLLQKGIDRLTTWRETIAESLE